MPEDLDRTILELLEQRREGATICPSDAAKAAAGDDGWRPLMEPTREAARRLLDQGRIEVTQRGEVVDLADARGPVRLRLKR
jgi:Protein of unknown function (DUF3253)